MIYNQVMIVGLIPFSISQMYSSTLREISETVIPMRAGIIAVFINLIFNYILIYGKFGAPALGVMGAAVATVLSRVTECAIIVIWTHTHPLRAPFIVGVYKDPRVPRPVIAKALRLALPLFANELLWSSGMTTLNQIMSRRGLEVVSALNISSTTSNLFACAFFSIGMSLGIIAGQIPGAGEKERAVDEVRKITAFSFAITAVLGVALILAASAITRICNVNEIIEELS